MRRLAPFALVLLFAACDTSGTTDPVRYGGVEVTPSGGTTLSLDSGDLVVDNVPATADGGFTIAGLRQRIDVRIEPLTLPLAARFGARVTAANGTEVAAVFAEGLDAGRVRIRYAFAEASQVTRVRIVYKLGDAVVFEIPDLPVPASGNRSALGVQAREGSAGDGEGKSGSVHVVREGGRYIVVSDSEQTGNRAAGTSGDCLGYLLTPITGAGAPPNPICTDLIEITPLDGQAPEGAQTAVFARGVSSFRVQSLAVQ